MRGNHQAWPAATAATALGMSVICSCGVTVQHSSSAPKNPLSVQCIAVLPFAGPSGAQRIGSIVAEAVAHELWLSKRLGVIEPVESGKKLEELGFSDANANNPRVAAEVARSVGAQAILIGTVTDFVEPAGGSQAGRATHGVAFSFRLVEAETGDVIWAASANAVDRSYLLAIPQSPLSIVERIAAESLAPLLNSQRAQAETASLCSRYKNAIAARQRESTSPTQQATSPEPDAVSAASSTPAPALFEHDEQNAEADEEPPISTEESGP